MPPLKFNQWILLHITSYKYIYIDVHVAWDDCKLSVHGPIHQYMNMHVV